jgi:hypothetical protein
VAISAEKCISPIRGLLREPGSPGLLHLGAGKGSICDDYRGQKTTSFQAYDSYFSAVYFRNNLLKEVRHLN